MMCEAPAAYYNPDSTMVNCVQWLETFYWGIHIQNITIIKQKVSRMQIYYFFSFYGKNRLYCDDRTQASPSVFG